MDEHQSNFPKDFWWGASTSSHQVEGGNHNQWTVWELAHAKERAQTAHKRYSHLPNWENIKDQAENPSNYVSGEAINHWGNYKNDFDFIEKMNLNAFRFSIEWSRIEPQEGKWDQSAIGHYKKYIKELRERGIEPFLNIWHWTNPVWFEEKGGFERKSNRRYFERFVKKVADELIEDVTYIITLNEPNVYSTFGYLTGIWPPQKKNVVSFGKVYWNLTHCHKTAYKILKSKKPTLEVGLASQLANIQPKRAHNAIDLVFTQWMRFFWNWWFLNRTKKHQDFIGLNYYFSDYYKGLGKKDNPNVPLNDLGWYMEPEGLYSIVERTWVHYKKPIIVTENGAADAYDQHRQWWIEQSIVAMEKAISEGIQVKGYLHWSLLDNFEWADGWWPKFGLVEVDRENGMKRKLRPSAKWFGESVKKIRQN